MCESLRCSAKQPIFNPKPRQCGRRFLSIFTAYQVAVASNKNVYAAAGTFYELDMIVLQDGVSIFGGFTHTGAGGQWSRDGSAGMTRIIVSTATAIRAENIDERTVLEMLWIESSDVPMSVPSLTAYGVFARNSDGLVSFSFDHIYTNC